MVDVSLRKMSLFKCNPEDKELVAKWLGTTCKAMDRDVEIVREWCESQPHFPEVMDRKQIKRALALHKLSIENTKKAIDCYYTLPSKFPEIFEHRNPKLAQIKALFDICIGVPSKDRTEEMDRIFFFKMLRPDLCEKVNPYHLLALIMNWTEVRMWKEYRCSDIFVVDVQGLNISHLSLVTPSLVATIRYINKNLFKERAKATYVVNAPSFCVSFLKTVLRPKVFHRLNIYTNSDVLQKVVPKNILPKDYDGEGPTLKELQQLAVEELDALQDRFDKLDQLRVDESRRPEKLENDDILGFYGTFKKLTVD